MVTNFFIPELNNHDVQELWFQQDSVAVVAEWYRYRTVAFFVTSSSPVPLKNRHNVKHSPVGVIRKLEEEVPLGAQMSSSSLGHGSKLRYMTPIALVQLNRVRHKYNSLTQFGDALYPLYGEVKKIGG
ncbi:hypothetical protein TNCV_3902071 [Trichonephila clavipes]|nr:hypothetical protein TNCV_3902071 [Trichonephila clavipes]